MICHDLGFSFSRFLPLLPLLCVMKQEFQMLNGGLKSVGCTTEELEGIYSVIAGLLCFGNIKFEDEDTAEGNVAAVTKEDKESDTALKGSASHLGVAGEGVSKIMMQRTVSSPRGEKYVIRRDSKNASYARDAISKFIYSSVFEWIIGKINRSLATGRDVVSTMLPFIGVLDIFGFESFKKNGFEQLLINFTNEVLQATFSKQVFIAEQELYKFEGLIVSKIEWPDNRECVELIGSKPKGIIALLDNEGRNPKPTDLKFNEQLHKTHKFNTYFPKTHPKDTQDCFFIRHFAGDVKYNVHQFIDKNNDTSPDGVEAFLSTSSNPIILEMLSHIQKSVCLSLVSFVFSRLFFMACHMPIIS
jgi:myosin heavy subunit